MGGRDRQPALTGRGLSSLSIAFNETGAYLFFGKIPLYIQIVEVIDQKLVAKGVGQGIQYFVDESHLLG